MVKSRGRVTCPPSPYRQLIDFIRARVLKNVYTRASAILYPGEGEGDPESHAGSGGHSSLN